MTAWNETTPKPGPTAKLWVVTLLVIVFLLAATLSGLSYNEPARYRARAAAATATHAAIEFHAQLTAMAAEGDCIPMPCPTEE